MSVLQNDVRHTLKYVKILINIVVSASIIHNSFVFTNRFNFENKSHEQNVHNGWIVFDVV